MCIRDRKVTVAQLKEWRKAAENKAEWQKSNTLKSQEIAAERKRLAEAEIIYNVLQKDPQKLQKLLAPEPERDFDAELQSHYQKRPTEDPNEYLRWEMEKDRLIAQKASTEAFNKARQQAAQEFVKETNDRVVNAAYDKYKEKVNDEEFKDMASWISENVKPRLNGTYPESAFDIAYSVKHGNRDVERAKLETTKAVAKSIEKAKPASGENGQLKKTERTSPEDAEDEAFAEEIKARSKK